MLDLSKDFLLLGLPVLAGLMAMLKPTLFSPTLAPILANAGLVNISRVPYPLSWPSARMATSSSHKWHAPRSLQKE